MMDDATREHVTECDGLEASWTLNRHVIRISGVYDTSENFPVVSLDQGPYPDLADARSRWPKLARLWDAVRHDYWSAMVGPGICGRSVRPAADDPAV
ncbi:hypothetical protein [Nocardia blacklockiae]|uniref:hypothetical protein n=1 Tax=Nocardia blacklockiae TaxID=480036 RepID=UPI001894ABA3|nr:hypothetical protein [Nocardia blacklockiae]MBF6176791.1 hypothetical protein [Nocardia blacklockiae]